ncbi:hypothetical protein BJ875DRAFT_484388 [Amylocarpus encephaloides]|uniref:Uncharacterized protein n=1 Tax=Amylocarpus encephaloides TaxID=45428 RepID=A0A9P7YIQ0_9HELO|nr:hypothetical protein BJ875DRAFT_484388 [Amylocarpus encephaloides]
MSSSGFSGRQGGGGGGGGNGGSGGSGGVGGSGSSGGGAPEQGNPNQFTSTTAPAQEAMSTSGFLTSTTTSSPSTSTTSESNSTLTSSDSSSLSPKDKGIVIGSVLGGILGIALLFFLAIWLLSRKKKQKKLLQEQKRTTVESRTYTGLNQAFAGVPFRRSNHSQADTLLGAPPPSPMPLAVFSPTSPVYRDGSPSPSPTPYSITPEASIRMVPSDPSLLQSYSDSAPGRSLSGRASQNSLGRSSQHSLGRFNTSARISTVAEISPMTPENMSICETPAPIISPQSLVELPLAPVAESPVATPMTPRLAIHGTARDTIDTMGFPVERNEIEIDQGPY